MFTYYTVYSNTWIKYADAISTYSIDSFAKNTDTTPSSMVSFSQMWTKNTKITTPSMTYEHSENLDNVPSFTESFSKPLPQSTDVTPTTTYLNSKNTNKILSAIVTYLKNTNRETSSGFEECSKSPDTTTSPFDTDFDNMRMPLTSSDMCPKRWLKTTTNIILTNAYNKWLDKQRSKQQH